VGGKGGGGGRGEKWPKPCMNIWIIKEKKTGKFRTMEFSKDHLLSTKSPVILLEYVLFFILEQFLRCDVSSQYVFSYIICELYICIYIHIIYIYVSAEKVCWIAFLKNNYLIKFQVLKKKKKESSETWIAQRKAYCKFLLVVIN
jgi:hypothetical protein